MTPTLTFAQTAWDSVTTPKASPSVSWGTDDIVVVLGLMGDNSTNCQLLTPTAAGLAFDPLDVDPNGSGTGTNCWAGSWWATAGSPGSGAISVGRGSNNTDFGFMVIVASDHGGLGVHTKAEDADLTTSLALNGPDSAVLFGAGDWGAAATTGHGYTPGGASDRVATQVSGIYTVYGATWDGQSAGTRSYGLSGITSGPYSKLLVEIMGTGAAPETSGPNYAGAGSDLGGGSGSWVNPSYAGDGDNANYAVWTVP